MNKFIFSILLILTLSNTCLADAPSSDSIENHPTSKPAKEINLSPYRAKYEATWKAGWFPITVQATRTLQQTEDHLWQLSFEAYSSIADLSEITKFQVTDTTIKPQSYRYKTTGFLTKSKRSQEFNWDENKLWLPNKDTWADYELPENLQDNLSYQEQIRLDLMAGQTEFHYPIAYKNRLKHYHFEVVGETQLKGKQGPITAIQVKQTQLKHKKESTNLWYAKDYENIMLKLVKVRRNGDKHTILLKEAQLKNEILKGF